MDTTKLEPASSRPPTPTKLTLPPGCLERIHACAKERGQDANTTLAEALNLGLSRLEADGQELLDYVGAPVEVLIDGERTPVRGELSGETPEHVIVLNDESPRFLPKPKIRSIHLFKPDERRRSTRRR